MRTKIQLGDIAKDVITGFQGVVESRSVWLHNCPRFAVQPRETKDGKPIAARTFDEMSLTMVGPSKIEVLAAVRPKKTVELGDLVEDRISGLKGIAIGWTVWLNGCSRITIQPKELHEGLPVDASTIDEKDVLILERAGADVKPAKTGGPRPDPRRS